MTVRSTQGQNRAVRSTQGGGVVTLIFKTIAAAWRSRRWHSAHKARTQRCWRLHSANLGCLQLLGRCGNAVRTPLWCDRSFIEVFVLSNTFKTPVTPEWRPYSVPTAFKKMPIVEGRAVQTRATLQKRLERYAAWRLHSVLDSTLWQRCGIFQSAVGALWARRVNAVKTPC